MVAYSNKLKRGRLIQWSLFLVKLIGGNNWLTIEQVGRSDPVHCIWMTLIISDTVCYLFRNELRGLCKKDLCDVQAPWRSKLWCLPNDVIPLGYLYQILEVLNYSWQLIDWAWSFFQNSYILTIPVPMVSLGEIYCRYCFTLSCVNPSNGNVDDWEIKEEDK